MTRRFINWTSLKCGHEFGDALWSCTDDIVTVKTCRGTKTAQLLGRTPEGVARILTAELSQE
jgi:hypothetical protein